MNDGTHLKVIIGFILIGALVGGTILATRNDDVSTAETSTNQQTTNADTTASIEQTQQATVANSADAPDSGDTQTTSPASPYADGTYTAEGSYIAPPGQEAIGVTITLADSVITDVDVTARATHPKSEEFQAEFINEIAALVSGVHLDDVSVDQVSGSSLTSKGFNDALAQIREEAAS